MHTLSASDTPAIASFVRRTPSTQLQNMLRARFGDRFTTNAAVLLQHGRDESFYPPQPPDAVIFVRTTEEVAYILASCSAERTPVIGYGVGSSVEGHLLAVEGGICVDFSQMNEVLEIRPGDLNATVQAGVTRTQLNAALQGSGLFFSVDPGADASLGGMVATGASGTNTVRYGTMRENIVNLVVVTASGEVVRTASRARKSSAGYNLTQTYCGSEGTLGLITEVTVRLHPLPEAIAAAVVTFPDVRSAVECVIDAIQTGVPLARAEMLDELALRAINAHSRTELAEKPTLFLEFAGSQAQIDVQTEIMRELAANHGGGEFQWAVRPEERSRLWTPRHHAYFACLQLRPGSRSLSTDACVPLSELATCIEETQADVRKHGLLVPIFGHVGDGNFHCMVLIDPNSTDEIAAAEGFAHRLVERAIRLDGTCTGEHGVGLHKSHYLTLEHGKAGTSLMRALKNAFDPNNILNPGKVVSTSQD